MTRPVVTFLTDYGPHGEHVGALHAVVAATHPAADRIDLAHDVPAGDVAWGALVLARLAVLLPRAVHLAVVDPGVGTSRRGIAVRLNGGGALVGPDNGLLVPAARALGAAAVVVLDPERVAPGGGVSATFHGRDLFAPVAARLAAGDTLDRFGRRTDPDDLVTADLPAVEVGDGSITAAVAGRDRFGNVQCMAGAAALSEAGLRPGDTVSVAHGATELSAVVGRTFADVPHGGDLVHIDAHGLLAVARNMGDAAAVLGVRRSGGRLTVRRVASPPDRNPAGST